MLKIVYIMMKLDEVVFYVFHTEVNVTVCLFVCLFEWTPSRWKEVGIPPLGTWPHV